MCGRRPWYNRTTWGWTDIYVFTNDQLGITYSVPIINASNVSTGVVGVDYELQTLNILIGGLRIPENGIVYVVDTKQNRTDTESMYVTFFLCVRWLIKLVEKLRRESCASVTLSKLAKIPMRDGTKCKLDRVPPEHERQESNNLVGQT